jgi:hypothetical protein
MLTAPAGTPKYTTRESALPKSAQKRLAQLRALVDDHESARANLQKRLGALRPDESMDRAELDRRMTANNAALSYVRGLLGRVDQWLVASGALAHVAPTSLAEAPSVKVGSAEWGRVENIRTEVARIKGQMVEVRRAPLPFSMIEAQLKVTVNKWASEGEPRLELDPVKGSIDVSWGFNTPKSHRVLAWLHKDAMLTRLTDMARKQVGSRGEALTPEAKTEALETLRKRLQDLELEEVALIDAMQSQGVTDAQHRLDISPAALLGVREPKGLMKTSLVA